MAVQHGMAGFRCSLGAAEFGPTGRGRTADRLKNAGSSLGSGPSPSSLLSTPTDTLCLALTMPGPAVKIQHGEIVRKVTLPSSLAWAGVSSLVRDRFQLGQEVGFVLTYKDQDGDVIAVVSGWLNVCPDFGWRGSCGFGS